MEWQINPCFVYFFLLVHLKATAPAIFCKQLKLRKVLLKANERLVPPSKHETLTQCCFNVGHPSSTFLCPAQLFVNI